MKQSDRKSIYTSLSEESRKFLEEAKNNGHPKGNIVDRALRFLKMTGRVGFWSAYDWHTTQPEFDAYDFLCGLKEHFIDISADDATIGALEKAIVFQKQRLKALEEGKLEESKKP